MCESPGLIKSIASFYFLGYTCGSTLFVLPNLIGRKKAMTVSVFMALVSTALLIYGDSINIKMIGFFIQGYFHIKLTLVFPYCSDFVENRHKQIVVTLINVMDTVSITLCALFITFVSPDLIRFIEIWFFMNVAFFVVFVLVMPESPRQLF